MASLGRTRDVTNNVTSLNHRNNTSNSSISESNNSAENTTLGKSNNTIGRNNTTGPNNTAGQGNTTSGNTTSGKGNNTNQKNNKNNKNKTGANQKQVNTNKKVNNQGESIVQINNLTQSKFLKRLVLFFIVISSISLVVNIIWIYFSNVIQRKDFIPVEGLIIDGKCVDKGERAGATKTKCTFEVQFEINKPSDTNKSPSDSNMTNQSVRYVKNIVIKDKNLIREKPNGQRVIHLDVNPQDVDNIKIKRDLVRMNMKSILSMSVLILILILLGVKYNRM